MKAINGKVHFGSLSVVLRRFALIGTFKILALPKGEGGNRA